MSGRDDDDDDHHSFLDRRHSYDVNSRIMLTAIISLSFVVIVVAILHIYFRCVLRRQERRQNFLSRFTAVASANVRTAEPPKTGLDAEVIAALPTFVFRQTGGDGDGGDQLRSGECAVCISSLEDGEIARTLPNCKHTFHAKCIDRWLGSNSTCPICRTEAEPRLVAEPREGMVVPTAAPPSAPPLEGTSDGKVSGSRLSSFRRILSRERSSRMIRVQPRAEEDIIPDLERQ